MDRNGSKETSKGIGDEEGRNRKIIFKDGK